jgi:hypothetical protein
MTQHFGKMVHSVRSVRFLMMHGRQVLRFVWRYFGHRIDSFGVTALTGTYAVKGPLPSFLRFPCIKVVIVSSFRFWR